MSAHDDDDDLDLEADFRCPIYHTVMVDPVMLCTGNSFERSAITAWLRRGGKPTDPLTGAELEDLTLTPNESLRDLIQLYQNNEPFRHVECPTCKFHSVIPAEQEFHCERCGPRLVQQPRKPQKPWNCRRCTLLNKSGAKCRVCHAPKPPPSPDPPARRRPIVRRRPLRDTPSPEPPQPPHHDEDAPVGPPCNVDESNKPEDDWSSDCLSRTASPSPSPRSSLSGRSASRKKNIKKKLFQPFAESGWQLLHGDWNTTVSLQSVSSAIEKQTRVQISIHNMSGDTKRKKVRLLVTDMQARTLMSAVGLHVQHQPLCLTTVPSSEERFELSSSSKVKTKPCTFYAQGLCKKGAECTFIHEPSALTQKRTACPYFRRGTCNYGNACLYLHEQDHTNPRSTSNMHRSLPHRTSGSSIRSRSHSRPSRNVISSAPHSASHSLSAPPCIPSVSRGTASAPASRTIQAYCERERQGFCPFGDECFFLHRSKEQSHTTHTTPPLRATPHATPPHTPPRYTVQAVCKYEDSSGRCQFGDDCKLVHLGKARRERSEERRRPTSDDEPRSNTVPLCRDRHKAAQAKTEREWGSDTSGATEDIDDRTRRHVLAVAAQAAALRKFKLEKKSLTESFGLPEWKCRLLQATMRTEILGECTISTRPHTPVPKFDVTKLFGGGAAVAPAAEPVEPEGCVEVSGPPEMVVQIVAHIQQISPGWVSRRIPLHASQLDLHTKDLEPILANRSGNLFVDRTRLELEISALDEASLEQIAATVQAGMPPHDVPLSIGVASFLCQKRKSVVPDMIARFGLTDMRIVTQLHPVARFRGDYHQTVLAESYLLALVATFESIQLPNPTAHPLDTVAADLRRRVRGFVRNFDASFRFADLLHITAANKKVLAEAVKAVEGVRHWWKEIVFANRARYEDAYEFWVKTLEDYRTKRIPRPAQLQGVFIRFSSTSTTAVVVTSSREARDDAVDYIMQLPAGMVEEEFYEPQAKDLPRASRHA